MDETDAMDALIQEMELTRNEMAALTDALNRLNHAMNNSSAETRRLATVIEESQQRGFWQRFVR